MIEILKTTSKNGDFINLVKHLDTELALRDGEDHAFYSKFNKINMLKHAVVAYKDKVAIGCGAFKAFNQNSVEIKRMYLLPEHRGKGIAVSILTQLEHWAKELSFKKCVLETGKNQPEAISLYKKNGYKIIPNYGQYAHIENSVCFEKII